MKVTNVDLYSASNYCNFSFNDPTSQGPYIVRGITGLDADEIIPRYYGSSEDAANKYYMLSPKSREIAILLSLNPYASVPSSYSTLRDTLYKLIASSRTGLVQLRFNNGNDTVAAVSGYISKFEASHFSQKPEVQITINCDDGMLRALDPVSIDISELNPDSTVIEDPLSTAPHGFKFQMTFDDDSDSFVMTDESFDWALSIEPVGLGGFLIGDVLYFSSELNNKYLYMIREEVTYHLADSITPGSIWPILFPGSNTFLCSSGVSWDAITHYPTYWGV